MLTEPTTLITDYALSIANAYFAYRLLSGEGRARHLWGLAFVSFAVAAFTGGSYHGFADILGRGGMHSVLWQLTEAATGIGMFCLLLAMADLFLHDTASEALVFFAAIKLAVYAAAAAISDDFRIIICDSVLTMAAILMLGLRAIWLRHHPAGRWLVGSVAVSMAAAVLQQAGFAPHPDFNHNDLYHVVQLIGFWLLYEGGLRFETKARTT